MFNCTKFLNLRRASTLFSKIILVDCPANETSAILRREGVHLRLRFDSLEVVQS